MRLRTNIHHPKRAGLTLVEMLIALALSIFIMSILSEAFVKGLEVFGQYKALADLEQRLRTVANIVRRDLRAKHFDGDKKLSELTESGKPMPMLDGLQTSIYNRQSAQILLRQLQQYRFKSPNEGFFSVEELPNRVAVPDFLKTVFEGQDATLRPSYRDRYDVLHFTSRLEGNEPDKFFYGKVRGGSPLDNAGNFSSRYDSAVSNSLYTSQAAEMLYFTGADDTHNFPGAGLDLPDGSVLTFNLYRQAWLLIPSGFSSSAAPIGDNTYASSALFTVDNDISAQFIGAAAFYNTIASVQHRDRRRQAPYSPRLLASGNPDGSDILLTNVISFDVKVFDPFAYKIPMNPLSGRGAYVDIGDVMDNVIHTGKAVAVNPMPTAAGFPNNGAAGDEYLQPVFGGPINNPGFLNLLTADPKFPTGYPVFGFFDTGTNRFEGDPAGPISLSPAQTPSTHPFPFTSIQITIRVYEPKSRQTRQITIIQDM